MNSTEKTLRHILRVNHLMGVFAKHLITRGSRHDASKLSPEEAGPLEELDKIIEVEGNVPFASAEYDKRKELLAPMLAHHYANNSHHPEHFDNGVDGMTLLDLIEMFLDWKAASERGEESSMNLAWACKKYNVSPQIEAIFRNTAQQFEWATD